MMRYGYPVMGLVLGQKLHQHVKVEEEPEVKKQEDEEQPQKGKGRRIRKWEPGPKDKAQERCEQLHKLTLDNKSLRDQMDDLRDANETKMHFQALTHEQTICCLEEPARRRS